MLKPRPLRPGDRIAIVAPASAFNREEFDRGVEELRTRGFDPVYEDSVFERRTYVAGPPELRAAAIHGAWQDPTVAALIAARGGYGAAQVLPLLDRELARRACKPFIGYSDTTALLTYFTLHCDLVAFHGPMLDRRLSRGASGYDLDSFTRALCRREPVGELAPEGLETIAAGEASGILLGGTVTQLLASLGTPFAFEPPSGYVLFFDEVGERPYRLDRMVTQLRQTGLLARASAVVVGELPGCDEPSGDPKGYDLMRDLFGGFPGPVIIGFPSGHTTRPLVTLPFGVRARVIGGSRPRVVVEESAVQ
jgi:muramoyltetrapeptide carboxypeptidase